ncbi:MAG TPA: carboxypeptidase-like regulatory domain-containing protein [Candidatus Acidoferrum sp.]|jgi:hypothetical protein|nr:carboxypeptidase-like regulatory domain-containing protein [Candidatus Acidoferrum sp.]
MRLWSALLFAATAAAACKCEATNGACREAATSNVIFIGTVESIAPTFLDTWNESQKSSLELLNREYQSAGADHSPAAFARLRDAYLKVFPDLPPEHKRRLERAASPEQLADLFYWILDHGKRVRFTVRVLYRNGDDDDDESDHDAAAPRTLEIWTAFGECGVNFQAGETYLVYADSDEESDVVTTTACHRTRRLSEAGDDLAYLYFRKNQRKQSARLEVFVTGDVATLKQRDREHYSDRIAAPAQGATVVVDGERRVRVPVDEYGRAVFDGLTPGDYQVSVFAPGYPQEQRVLAEPRKVTLDARGCGLEVLVTAPAR